MYKNDIKHSVTFVKIFKYLKIMLFSRKVIVIRFYQKCWPESLGIITTKWKDHWIVLNKPFCLFVFVLSLFVCVLFIMESIYQRRNSSKISFHVGTTLLHQIIKSWFYLYHTQCFKLQIIKVNLRHNIILPVNIEVYTSKIFLPITVITLNIHNNYLIS